MTYRMPTAFALVTLSLLSACSTTGTPAQNAAAAVSTAPSTQFEYVATVPVRAGETPQSLGQSLGAQVLDWSTPDCLNDCTALVGFSSRVGRAGALQALGGRKAQLERNIGRFTTGVGARANAAGAAAYWAMGAAAYWAMGAAAYWAMGAAAYWAMGQYSMVPQNTSLWEQVKLQQGQALAPRLGEGVTVAVIDTGIDLQHPAFQGALADPSTWHDFLAGDDVPQEEGTAGEGAYGHGTNVAGIVLQIAPHAKLMPLRVLGSDGSGDVSGVTQAIRWAVDKGAQVINLSLGSSESSPAVQAAIDWAAAHDVLVVASAGNEDGVLNYPAANATQGSAAENLLSVGSVDEHDLKSSFSNYGPALEVVAPGEHVYAPAPESRLVAWSGTSMAAPIAAGGLALALGQTLDVPVRSLIETMKNTTSDVYAGGANASYTGLLGRGRLDLAAFLEHAVR